MSIKHIFEKTPTELYLEQKVDRLEAELKWLKQGREAATIKSVFDEPSMMEVPFEEETLRLAATVGARRDPCGGYHVIARSRNCKPDIMYKYFLSENVFFHGYDKMTILARMHEKMIMELSTLLREGK